MSQCINSLTTKKQTTKFLSANFQIKKIKSMLYHIESSKTKGANSVDLDEVAQFEPPHQDLCCLQIQLFSSLVLKELNRDSGKKTIPMFFFAARQGLSPQKITPTV